ncbi:MAG TPA: outer membrane beta-barrel protein [Flavobacteriales bacterium]|mgnify:FL=1|nr:outer membrane beta-barrel protein [Flavobacteriales bacterium]
MKLRTFPFFLLIVLSFAKSMCYSQVANTGMVEQMDSSEAGKIVLSGYVDTYYGFDFNQPPQSDRPYTVSSPRHNEVNINLAYLGVNYSNEKVRGRFIPGFGNYMNSNYATEIGSLKNIVEANAGVRLSKKNDIWIDAGVMGSPYTNESAISRDHLMYTRSFAPEFVPYYLTGVKLSGKLSPKITGYFYILNGWQHITDTNNPLSIGTQIEYRPTSKLLINWNTYVGDEYSTQTPTFGIRYFSDIYVIFNPDGKFTFTSCFYAGNQQIRQPGIVDSYAQWWQANFIARYSFNKTSSISGRLEYFNDPEKIQISPITNSPQFSTASTGLCYNYKITRNALFRVEYRNYFSEKPVYLRQNRNVNNDNLLISNLTVWF